MRRRRGARTPAVFGSAGYALSRVTLTQAPTIDGAPPGRRVSPVIVARFNNTASRTRTEWNGSAWGTPPQVSSWNDVENFQMVGLQVDGANQRYRWHAIGNVHEHSGDVQHAITDWTAFSFHEGTAASYCNPTCASLRRAGIGDISAAT